MATKTKYGSKEEILDDDGKAVGVRFLFKGQEVLDCYLSALTADRQAQAAVHGLRQKIGDAFGSNPHVTTAEEAAAVAREEWRRLQDGEWSRRGSGDRRESLVVEAIAALRELPIEDVRKTWEGLNKEVRKKLRADPRVAAKAAEIDAARKEQAASAASTSEAIEELFPS